MEILLELGANELDQLRKTFLHNNGLSLSEFITVMFELLPYQWKHPDSHKVSTTKMLIDTFAQVDVNGDGNMSWEEMMAALIDAGSPSGRTAARHAFRFREHESFSRTTRHSLRVSKIVYIPQLRLLAATEEGRKIITFYSIFPKDDPSLGYQQVFELDTYVPGETDGGEVFDIQYIQEHNLLMLAVGDFSIQFWDCRPLQYRLAPALLHAKIPMSNTAATNTLGEAANRDNNTDSSFGSQFDMKDGTIQKKRKALPGMPQDIPPLPSHLDPTQSDTNNNDKNKDKKRKNDDDEDDDDVDDLGPVKEIIIQVSGKKVPVFIRKIHCPSPQRLLCWVPTMNKLLTAGASSEIMVWHLVIDRLGFGTWDIRAHIRGILNVHTRQVTNITLLKDIGLIASSSLDSSICFWGIRGMDDGIGGKRGFKDSPGYQHGKKLPKDQAAGGIYLASKHSGTAHKRGVRTLCWLPSVRLLLSGGYENHITVWDMTLDNGTELYQLNGHLKGILSLTSLEPENSTFDAKANKALLNMSGGTSGDLVALKRKLVHYAHVLSVDEGGEFRWWDCSRDMALLDENRCLQTMQPYSVTVTKQRYAARGIVCIRYAMDPYGISTSTSSGNPDSGSAEDAVIEAAQNEWNSNGAVVLGVGPRWVCFEAIRQDDDRAIPVISLYHDITTNILSLCQQDIRVFSTKNGFLNRVYRFALPGEVCSNSVSYDARRRKMIVGCNGGNVVVVNTFNCAVMKPLPRHFADISGVINVDEDGLVITSGWDGRLHISDESLPEMDGKKQGLLRRIKHAHGKGVPISALAFDYTLSLIATAGTSLSIFLWDYQDASFQGACIGHDAEITNLVFASPYPVLISADAAGIINVWLVERGKAVTCLASFGHDPVSVQTPLPITPTEHNMKFARNEMKQKVLTTLQEQIPKANKLPNARTVIGRLGAGPSLVPVMHESITSLTIIPPKKDLGKLMVSPAGKVEEFIERIEKAQQDPEEENEQLNKKNTQTVIKIETDVPEFKEKTDNDYPTLVVGDDIGRISFWNLRHILESIAIITTSTDNTTSKEGELRVVSGYFRDSNNNLLTADIASPKGTLGSAENNFRVVRNAVEPLHESKYPCKSASYHPKKLIKRSGPSPSLVQMTLAHVLEDVPDENNMIVKQEPKERVSSTGRKFMTSRKPIPPPSKFLANTTTIIPVLPSTATSSTAGFGIMSNDPDFERDAILAGDSWAFDIADIQAADEEEQRLLNEASSLLDNTMDAGYESGGGYSSNEEQSASPRATPISKSRSRNSAKRTITTSQSTRSESNQASNDNNNNADILHLHDDPAHLPSVKIPLIARALGDTWKSSKLVYAHGIFYGGSPTANAPVPTSDNTSIVTTEYGISWRGFSVKDVHFVNTIDITCIISSGEDGTVRIISVDGDVLGAIPVSTGRKNDKKASTSGTSSSATSRSNSVSSASSSAEFNKLLKKHLHPHADENGTTTTALANQGSNPSAAATHNMDWLVKLDHESREEILTAAAEDVLITIEEEAEHTRQVEEALATSSSSVEYADVKVYERRVRRSSIVAAANFVEPAEAKKLNTELAIAKSVGNVGDSTVQDEKSIERSKVLQQLLGEETWDKDPMAIAREKRAQDITNKYSGTQKPKPVVSEQMFSGEGVDDPSFLTLIELTKADAEERARQQLMSGGKPKLYRSVDPNAIVSPTSVLNEDDDEDDPVGSPRRNKGGNDENKVVITMDDINARKSETDKRLAKVRSVASRAETQAGGTIVKVNGITLEDPVRKATAIKQLSREKQNYPSLYAELVRALEADSKNSSSTNTTNTTAKVETKETTKSTSTGNSQSSTNNNMSSFLSANLHKLTPKKANPRTPSKSRNDPIPGTTITLASPPPPTLVSLASPTSSVTHAAGGGAAAVRSAKKPTNSTPYTPTSSSHHTRANEQMSKVNALMEMFDATNIVKSTNQIEVTRDPLSTGDPTVPRSSRSHRRQSVAQLLNERNPELLKDLEALKEKGRRGSLLRSMDSTEIQQEANKLIKEHTKEATDLLNFKRLDQEQKAAVLDDLAGLKSSNTKEKVDEVTPNPTNKLLSAAATAITSKTNKNSRAKSPGKALSMVSLTPEQYYIMSKRARIGGQFKRDIVTFIELIRNIDKDNSGDISYEEFVNEIETGKAGLSHMKRHLESMFRSADKDGSGTLSIMELTEVMFPKATPQQRVEIVAYSTYVGPTPKMIAATHDRIYSDDTLRQLRDLFNIYDRDGSGTIDSKEMAAVLQTMAGILNSANNHSSTSSSSSGGGGPPNAQAQAAIEEAELILQSASGSNNDNNNGEISFEQFVKLMGPAFEPDEDENI